MKNLKKLSAAIALTFVLAMVAFAGETSSPPCAPDGGQTNTPPCANAPMTAGSSVAPGETNCPPASGDASSVAEMAVDLLQSVLFF